MKTVDKHIITEGSKMSQMNLRKKFKFLDAELMNQIVMDIWHYVDPRYVDKGAMVFSKRKSFTDEIISRVNLDSYSEYVTDPAKTKSMMIKAIKSLNLDREWTYDKSKNAFIKN